MLDGNRIVKTRVIGSPTVRSLKSPIKIKGAYINITLLEVSTNAHTHTHTGNPFKSLA